MFLITIFVGTAPCARPFLFELHNYCIRRAQNIVPLRIVPIMFFRFVGTDTLVPTIRFWFIYCRIFPVIGIRAHTRVRPYAIHSATKTFVGADPCARPFLFERSMLFSLCVPDETENVFGYEPKPFVKHIFIFAVTNFAENFYTGQFFYNFQIVF